MEAAADSGDLARSVPACTLRKLRWERAVKDAAWECVSDHIVLEEAFWRRETGGPFGWQYLESRTGQAPGLRNH